MLDFEQCEQIGIRVEDRIIQNIVKKLNDSHQSLHGLSFIDRLSIDLTESVDILSESNPEAYKEIIILIKEEYRALDELEQHCLYLYLFTSDKEEDEIVESLACHFEEWLEDKGFEFLSKAKSGNKYKN